MTPEQKEFTEDIIDELDKYTASEREEVLQWLLTRYCEFCGGRHDEVPCVCDEEGVQV